MKKHLPALSVIAFVAVIVLLLSEINYRAAVNAARTTDGSDESIQAVMTAYGFRCDALGSIGTRDKVVAFINSNN
jgi:hypothetical protein